MPVPQTTISDRLRELPARALRTAFTGVGQLLLVADRVRSQAAEARQRIQERERAGQRRPAESPGPADNLRQADGGPQATGQDSAGQDSAGQDSAGQDSAGQDSAGPPAPAAVPDSVAASAPAAPPARAAGTAGEQRGAYAERWRSLDKTGNVRLLTAAELQHEEAGDGAAPAETVAAEPVPAETAPAETAPAETVPAETVPAETVPAAAQSTASLPVPNYDEATVASLRARLRLLDAEQVRALASYEAGHAARPDVLGMFERRIAKLESGA